MSAKSLIERRYRSHTKERIVQGDILRDLTFFEWNGFQDEGLEKFKPLKRRKLPYLVVLSQDCDLERDFENRNDIDMEDQDKFLQSVLACPAYIAEEVRKGTHLAELKLTMQSLNKDSWRKVKINSDPRYHYLKKDSDYQIPNLVVDFKHYYTIRRDVLYELYLNHYLASLNELFREELSHRFSFYLSRIGLPDFKPSEQSN